MTYYVPLGKCRLSLACSLCSPVLTSASAIALFVALFGGRLVQHLVIHGFCKRMMWQFLRGHRLQESSPWGEPAASVDWPQVDHTIRAYSCSSCSSFVTQSHYLEFRMSLTPYLVGSRGFSAQHDWSDGLKGLK